MRIIFGGLWATAVFFLASCLVTDARSTRGLEHDSSLNARENTKLALRREINDLVDELALRASRHHTARSELSQHHRRTDQLDARRLIERLYNELDDREDDTIEARSPGQRTERLKEKLRNLPGVQKTKGIFRKLKDKLKGKSKKKASNPATTNDLPPSHNPNSIQDPMSPFPHPQNGRLPSSHILYPSTNRPNSLGDPPPLPLHDPRIPLSPGWRIPSAAANQPIIQTDQKPLPDLPSSSEPGFPLFTGLSPPPRPQKYPKLRMSPPRAVEESGNDTPEVTTV